MNCYQSKEFRENIMGLSESGLYSLRNWYVKKASEGEEFVLLIDLEIKRREKLRRRYES